MKTVNLELSKKLKEEGFPQNYKYCWTKDYEDTEWYVTNNPLVESMEKGWIYASPTGDEILDQLPQYIEGKGWIRVWTGTSGKSGRGYHLGYAKILSEGGWITIESQADSVHTLADAAAKMWLYLKKNNLIDSGTKVQDKP